MPLPKIASHHPALGLSGFALPFAHVSVYLTPLNDPKYATGEHETRSSAIAETLRDASMLRVIEYFTHGHSRSLEIAPFAHPFGIL